VLSYFTFLPQGCFLAPMAPAPPAWQHRLTSSRSQPYYSLLHGRPGPAAQMPIVPASTVILLLATTYGHDRREPISVSQPLLKRREELSGSGRRAWQKLPEAAGEGGAYSVSVSITPPTGSMASGTASTDQHRCSHCSSRSGLCPAWKTPA